MNAKFEAQVSLMRALVAGSEDFNHLFLFENGTAMSVSRNHMIPGGKHGYVGVLPYDKAGEQIDARAENWLTADEVADKMDILASE